MILNFEVGNYLSFKDKQVLSFEHEFSSAEVFKENTIFEFKEDGKKHAILNGAVLLGANAAGKSNIFTAMENLRDIFIKSKNFDEKLDMSSRLTSFKFFSQKSVPISFKISFINNVDSEFYKLIYNISIDPDNFTIKDESLSYQKILKTTLSKEQMIFKREGDILDTNGEIKNIRSKIEKENIKYKTVLSLLIFDINESFYKDEIATISYRIARSIGNSIEKDLVFSKDTTSMDEFYEELNTRSDFKEYILASLNDFDFAITDFEVQDITDEVIDSLIVKNRMEKSDFEQSVFFKNFKQYKVNTLHCVDSVDYKLPISHESAGTKMFLQHSLRIYESILKEKIYISDEFESHYHIHIQEGLIKKFLNPNLKEDSKSQFLIITHNPMLLNPKFFAKEQIYFVEKSRKTEASYLYSLKDFNEISYNNHNWTNLYLSGRLGAVPEVFD